MMDIVKVRKELNSKVAKLKHNKEQCAPEDLAKGGRYYNAFQRLCREILEIEEKLIQEYLVNSFSLYGVDQSICNEYISIVNREQEKLFAVRFSVPKFNKKLVESHNTIWKFLQTNSKGKASYNLLVLCDLINAGEKEIYHLYEPETHSEMQLFSKFTESLIRAQEKTKG